MKRFHISIMAHEAISFLKPEKGGIFVDGTLGGGGHARALFGKCQGSKLPDKIGTGKCQIIGIDLDKEAIKEAQKRLSKFQDQVIFRQGNFSNIKNILDELEIDRVSGILLDLGVSNYQLTSPDRGFSYQAGDLDMRFNQNQSLTAQEIINHWSEKDLRVIFQKFGESPFGFRIARKIAQEREKNKIKNSDQLVEIIKKSTPPKWRFSRQKHFATNIFRALRMVVNNELENLEKSIPKMVDVLRPEGRLVIISFHSLEDRIVKRTFRQLANPCICPPKIPFCVCGKKPLVKIITQKPILPSKKEIEANPRARSAKLRVVEKLRI